MTESPIKIIERIYSGHEEAMRILIAHSEAVARKAVEIARSMPHLSPDLALIEESALLHDIGMIHTDAPVLGCSGSLPYICHGVLGREMLEAEGLIKHALVCERHVGMGLTPEDIRTKGFPLPQRQMVPVSLEEKIVCYADKFFSKLGDMDEKPLNEVCASIGRYGAEKLSLFDEMHKTFSIPE